MLLMFERGIRGGITQSVHRWAQANNPYMSSEYDSSKPTRYLQYLDTNNLYGWAMSQLLPTGGFRWADIHLDEISELVNCSDRGYLLEVDVAYPRELHDYHNSGNLRQGSRIHCLEKCCFLKDVNNSAYCSEIWPTN